MVACTGHFEQTDTIKRLIEHARLVTPHASDPPLKLETSSADFKSFRTESRNWGRALHRMPVVQRTVWAKLLRELNVFCEEMYKRLEFKSHSGRLVDILEWVKAWRSKNLCHSAA